MRTACNAAPKLAVLLLAALLPAAAAASGAAVAVDLKNDEARSVSVPLGADNGVTAESDFAVVVGSEQEIPVFPAEIFKDRFWSAPLSPDDYAEIRTGAAVVPYRADRAAHRLMRKLAAEQARAVAAEREGRARDDLDRKLSDLREKRSRLLAQREKLDGWIASAGRDVADERDRALWREDSADQDIARARQRIDDLTDQRNELQSQRDALPRNDRTGRERLTGQILSLNGRISAERDALRYAQDRKRDSRSFLQRDLADRRKLAADRDALSAEIEALDRRISELSGAAPR